ncbi:hypothetical protein ROJ8625_03845 [Roseivivax jejudonensis]|uniref:Glycosyltransferase RgtA/B/C/D-like domain-containing protein n=1 Tax=Roseivivax jejudonensis TaxID=1529041 RepID=A0A1X7A9Y3_9RHOB|nr:hypothetical protein [Roseivivax jejudonensis]SLN72522.1 hypothetical protein ROJ8625_03845 [Roseivivax jejudonensis]
MTYTATDASMMPRHVAVATLGDRLVPVFAATLLGVFAMSLPNLADPMIRHDDYPAFFGDADAFWNKTLHEGRWLSYVWHLRGFETPAWLNFSVYQGFWALFCAGLATAAIGRDGPRWLAILLALFIAAAPTALRISLWFNTLVPGVALIGVYAWLGCLLPQRQLRLCLPVFTVVAFMSYTMYPVLLLAICLVRTANRSMRDLAGLMALFVVSFAAAVFVTYAINWQVHGVFGVPLADWRGATPAGDLAGLVANLPEITKSVINYAYTVAYKFEPAIVFHVLLFVAGFAILRRRAPVEALYLTAGLLVGLGLVALQAMKLGVFVPARAYAFAWTFHGLVLCRALTLMAGDSALRIAVARVSVLLVVGGCMTMNAVIYGMYQPWRTETVALASVVAEAEAPIFVRGDVVEWPAAVAAGVQFDTAMERRMRQLTGRNVEICAHAPDECAAAEAGRGTVIDLP